MGSPGALRLCSPDVLGETGIGFSVTWFLLHRCLASYSIWIAEGISDLIPDVEGDRKRDSRPKCLAVSRDGWLLVAAGVYNRRLWPVTDASLGRADWGWAFRHGEERPETTAHQSS